MLSLFRHKRAPLATNAPEAPSTEPANRDAAGTGRVSVGNTTSAEAS